VLSDSAADSVCYPWTWESCTKRCQYYMNNTMNFNPKGYCDVDHSKATSKVTTKTTSNLWNQNSWYNNAAACEKAGFVWYEVSHSQNLKFDPASSFVCAHTEFTRVNQLGNGRADDIISQTEKISLGIVADKVVQGVNANRFMWTVPQIPTPTNPQPASYFPSMTNAYQSCILRLRYNISSADFQQWPKDAVDVGVHSMVDSHNNSRTQYDPRTPLHQDPYIYIGPGDTPQKGDKFVSLAVNTNQYGRTFQDRSYVFAIKPIPTTSSAASTMYDTPKIDAASIQSKLSAGGKIYNVNVRGKRGNIVQVYPSVEYDFVPNALALSTNDMIHFQWIGSDYNPRRGCNDGEGGPPDANTFSTDANADLNSRADRSNVVFMNHMGNNVPKDYLGYNHLNNNLTFAQKQELANYTVLMNAPCYNHGDSMETAVTCYQTIMRLAYLNQQLDSGSLVLRAGKNCLTQAELDSYANQDVAKNHPLNCAKLNAKPYTYFDGGIMFMLKNGWFPFYTTRNNNFSNRQNIGIICVGNQCKIDNSTHVLQDQNPESKSGTSVTRSTPSACANSANGEVGATANGGISCLPATTATPKAQVLTTQTFTIQQGDNDNVGDGNRMGCSVLTFSQPVVPGIHTVEQQVALAFTLLAVGLFTSWLSYYLYNRWQVHRAAEGKFRNDTAWQHDMELTGTKPPSSGGKSFFSMSNPLQLSSTAAPSAGPVAFATPITAPAAPVGTGSTPPKLSSAPRPRSKDTKRRDMI
jgi:hypothetical protein